MIVKYKDLNNYGLHCKRITRRKLNVLCFFGLFVCGWLLLWVLEGLGKKNLGYKYLLLLVISFTVSSHDLSPISLVALAIYIIGWIHANLILSGYRKLAAERIIQIDSLKKEDISIDVVLEKGMLQSNVLLEPEAAITSLMQGLAMPGGEPKLLNMAGRILLANNREEEAEEFFNKATSRVKEKRAQLLPV